MTPLRINIDMVTGTEPVVHVALGDEITAGVYVGRGNAIVKISPEVSIDLPSGQTLSGSQIKQALIALAALAESNL